MIRFRRFVERWLLRVLIPQWADFWELVPAAHVTYGRLRRWNAHGTAAHGWYARHSSVGAHKPRVFLHILLSVVCVRHDACGDPTWRVHGVAWRTSSLLQCVAVWCTHSVARRNTPACGVCVAVMQCCSESRALSSSVFTVQYTVAACCILLQCVAALEEVAVDHALALSPHVAIFLPGGPLRSGALFLWGTFAKQTWKGTLLQNR